MTRVKSFKQGQGEQFGRIGFTHRTHRSKKNRHRGCMPEINKARERKRYLEEQRLKDLENE